LAPFNQTNNVIIIYSYVARCKNEEEHLDDLYESVTHYTKEYTYRLVLLNDSDGRPYALRYRLCSKFL